MNQDPSSTNLSAGKDSDPAPASNQLEFPSKEIISTWITPQGTVTAEFHRFFLAFQQQRLVRLNQYIALIEESLRRHHMPPRLGVKRRVKSGRNHRTLTIAT